jgi:hypothetical protein
MVKRSKKTQKAQSKLQGFAVVVLTKDLEQAREYETLLKVNDIPAIITEQEEQSIGDNDIAVMVPEEYLDEAHVIIESQDAYDDFYDFTSEEDEDISDIDGPFFEDEF